VLKVLWIVIIYALTVLHISVQIDQSATLKKLYDLVIKSDYAVVVKPGKCMCAYVCVSARNTLMYKCTVAFDSGCIVYRFWQLNLSCWQMNSSGWLLNSSLSHFGTKIGP